MAEQRRTVTLPDGRTAQVMPPAIRDIVTRFLSEEMNIVTTVAAPWMRSDPERRAAMLVSLADASDVPRIVWDAMLSYLCFDAEPTCAECGEQGWVYDCLRDGAKLPVHRFLCEAHAPAGRYPTSDDGAGR